MSSLACGRSVGQETKQVKGAGYVLTVAAAPKAVLILFPCFPCNAENTRAEAPFLEGLEKAGITTLLLDDNQKIFLQAAEKQALAARIWQILDSNQVAPRKVYLGGFSSGGNVALLLGHHLLASGSPVQPEGVFAVDSPLDLERLYQSAQKDVARNMAAAAIEEGRFLMDFLEKSLGLPEDHPEQYLAMSPVLLSHHHTDNIQLLKNIKVRLYTEPDLEWQRENRDRVYEDLNAFTLAQTQLALKALGAQNVEFITTDHKGVRANGTRHPHSWSIVDRDGLLAWMLQ